MTNCPCSIKQLGNEIERRKEGTAEMRKRPMAISADKSRVDLVTSRLSNPLCKGEREGERIERRESKRGERESGREGEREAAPSGPPPSSSSFYAGVERRRDCRIIHRLTGERRDGLGAERERERERGRREREK